MMRSKERSQSRTKPLTVQQRANRTSNGYAAANTICNRLSTGEPMACARRRMRGGPCSMRPRLVRRRAWLRYTTRIGELPIARG
jgi:hypothetical protein